MQVTQAVAVESDSPGGRVSSFSQYILRLPCEDSLLPYQVTNEVVCRNLVAAKLPHVPVPRVFFYQATSRYDESFIAEEYIDGTPLSSHWMDLTPAQKQSVAERLAAIIVDIAEVRFDKIGGLDPATLEPSPTVEGSKLFKGRGEFHSQDYYHIGPYASTKEYVLACYDREICYYSQAPQHGIAIDSDLFIDTSVQDFVVQLQKKKDSLAAADIANEPFALVHGDFHGRNILADGGRVLAVLDWEFAGSYPLSETLSGGGIDVVEAVSEELDEENTVWNREIRGLIAREVARRGWEQGEIDLLMGDGNPEVGRAREEDVPLIVRLMG